ncbi:4000_t:CDS:1, partial [Ambispora gerdemannii]
MGNIPFTCPDSYEYPSPLLRTTCQIRAANLIFMWAFPIFCVFSGILISIDDDDEQHKNRENRFSFGIVEESGSNILEGNKALA